MAPRLSEYILIEICDFTTAKRTAHFVLILTESIGESNLKSSLESTVRITINVHACFHSTLVNKGLPKQMVGVMISVLRKLHYSHMAELRCSLCEAFSTCIQEGWLLLLGKLSKLKYISLTGKDYLASTAEPIQCHLMFATTA